jgi:predicted peptidase
MHRIIIVLLLSLYLPGCAIMTTNKGDRQISKNLVGENFKLKYLLYLPDNYKEQEKFPLVLFLHGSGERGNQIEFVKRHGPPRLVNEGKDFPFILVSPQCPKNERWNVAQLSELLNEIENSYKVDKERIYLTGLSMGGYGIWKMAAEYPERFAAILPVCGGGDFLNACVLKDIPHWVFHGAKDKIVSVQESERMVRALERCGGNVKFTVYPDAEHDSWTETYYNPEVYEWLLSNSRNQK